MAAPNQKDGGGELPLGQAEAFVAQLLQQVVQYGRSFAVVDEMLLKQRKFLAHQAKIKAQVYMVLRYYPRLKFILKLLCTRSLGKKQQAIACLLCLGLAQLMFETRSPHACVNACVQASLVLKQGWAKSFVNACLRRFIREKKHIMDQVHADQVALYAHPAWMVEQLQHDWPQRYKDILHANNQLAPMFLRVNQRIISRQCYLDALQQVDISAHPIEITSCGVSLDEPRGIDTLPGFFEGQMAVQDASGQLLTEILRSIAEQRNTFSPQRVLDACCAPGSKACLLLEQLSGVEKMDLLDKDATRLQLVRENIQRLHLTDTQINIQCADATETDVWWDGVPYDFILCDAPCSGSGVIRRHPDIKILRRAADIDTLCAVQKKLLHRLWPCLASGGVLVYATCSVFHAENHMLIQEFCATQPDALQLQLDFAWGYEVGGCRYILPGEQRMDGFCYVVLYKSD